MTKPNNLFPTILSIPRRDLGWKKVSSQFRKEDKTPSSSGGINLIARRRLRSMGPNSRRLFHLLLDERRISPRTRRWNSRPATRFARPRIARHVSRDRSLELVSGASRQPASLFFFFFFYSTYWWNNQRVQGALSPRRNPRAEREPSSATSNNNDDDDVTTPWRPRARL